MPSLRPYLIALMLASPFDAVAAASIQPEPDSGWQEKESAHGTRFMVAAAHPEAARAGVAMLEQGGNALDAAIAAQMALNVVEPQSSGIGGGGFLLYYDARSGQMTAYDGRETAPASMPPEAFLDKNGQPLPFLEAVRGGKSVGVPGMLRMLEDAHTAHGALAWNTLFTPAIALAMRGTPVSPRLNAVIRYSSHLKGLADFDHTYLQEGGAPAAVGAFLPNPALAESFRLIAHDGADALYRGELASAIVSAAGPDSDHPGYITRTDLAQYRVKQSPPLCMAYRVWRVCGFGPPAGGIVVLQALGILAHFDLPAQPYFSADAIHYMVEAEKLAFADRERYVADPDFVSVPVQGLLDEAYLESRAALIDPRHAVKKAQPGRVEAKEPPPPSLSREGPSTTHISVVDTQGNAVSMTNSIEHSFGSGLMAGGALLNNQLTDFSFLPRDAEGHDIANRIEGGKRPRSAISPIMVFDASGRLRLVIGSPGGVRIIPYVLQALLAVLDWHKTVQEALDAPHVLSINGPTELEAGHGLEKLGKELEARGHTVLFQPLTSGLHAISVEKDGLTGAADPRRDGIAQGE